MFLDNRIGGFGWYQKSILLIIGMCTGLVGFTTYSSVFAMAVPELFCRLKNSSDMTNQTFAESKNCEIFGNITASDEKSLNSQYECSYSTGYYGISLITEMNLICGEAWLANLTQTIFMIGCFSTFFIGYFSDKYGRRTVLLFVAVSINFVLILCSILNMKVLGFSDTVLYLVYAVSQFLLGNL